MSSFSNTLHKIGATLTLIPEAILSWQLLLLKDEKILPQSERTALEDKVEVLAQRMGIQKKIHILERDDFFLGAQAIGTDLVPGRVGIALDPHLFKDLSEGEQEFLLAHEIAHIKTSDQLTNLGVALVASIIAALAISILMHPAVIIAPLVSYAFSYISSVLIPLVTAVLFTRWREKCADLAAYDVCTPKGKKGAIDFFNKIRIINLAFKNETNLPKWKKFLRLLRINSQGDDRRDIFHPSLSSRIAYLTKDSHGSPQPAPV